MAAATLPPPQPGFHYLTAPPTPYWVKTVWLGLLLVPPVVSVVVSVSFAFVTPTLLRLMVAAVIATAITFPLLARWARRADRPDDWLPALLPVVGVPAFFLLLWVLLFLIHGRVFSTLGVFTFAGLPWLILSAAALFSGEGVAVPITLAVVLLAGLGGFVFGATRQRRPTGRNALIGVVAGCVALVTVMTGQLAPQLATAVMLGSQGQSMSDEVDLGDYRPFRAGNKLVTPDRTPSVQFTSKFPRLDGATALFPVYAAIGQATYVVPAGLDEDAKDDFVRTYLDCSTTSGAYDYLIEGDVDAVFVAQPSKGQLQKANAAGVELNLTPIGREAFIFFVSRDNPVGNLTLDQVRDIYSRRLTNWKQVGGRDEPIVAFQRPDDSGSQSAMLSLVMKDRQMAEPLREERAGGMGEIINKVAGYRNLTGALGYSFRWYATVMNANPEISLVSIDGVQPTVENIRNGSYPLTANLHIVTAGTPKPQVQKLIDWTLSPEGQALIEKTGYVGR